MDLVRLASFSTSQLTAFESIRNGACPYLSRAIRCRSGRRGPSETPFRGLSRHVSAHFLIDFHRFSLIFMRFAAVFARDAAPRVGLRRLRRLASAYLEEEADLARRQVLA